SMRFNLEAAVAGRIEKRYGESLVRFHDSVVDDRDEDGLASQAVRENQRARYSCEVRSRRSARSERILDRDLTYERTRAHDLHGMIAGGFCHCAGGGG